MVGRRGDKRKTRYFIIRPGFSAQQKLSSYDRDSRSRVAIVTEMGLLLVSCSQSSEVSGIYQQHKVLGSLKRKPKVISTPAYRYTCLHLSINDLLRVNLLRFAVVWQASWKVPAEEKLTLCSQSLQSGGGRVMLNLTRVNSARVSKDLFQMIRRENMKKAAFSYYASEKVNWYKLPGGQRKRKILKMWFSL